MDKVCKKQHKNISLRFVVYSAWMILYDKAIMQWNYIMAFKMLCTLRHLQIFFATFNVCEKNQYTLLSYCKPMYSMQHKMNIIWILPLSYSRSELGCKMTFGVCYFVVVEDIHKENYWLIMCIVNTSIKPQLCVCVSIFN